jgi:hypothetical protein
MKFLIYFSTPCCSAAVVKMICSCGGFIWNSFYTWYFLYENYCFDCTWCLNWGLFCLPNDMECGQVSSPLIVGGSICT